MNIEMAIYNGISDDLRNNRHYGHLIRANHYRDIETARKDLSVYGKILDNISFIIIGSIPNEGKVAKIYIDNSDMIILFNINNIKVVDLNNPDFPENLYRLLADELCPIPKILVI